MPIQIPDTLNLPEPVLACMHHRYLTTLPTLCEEPRLFGKPEFNAGFICVHRDLISPFDCRTAIVDGVVGNQYVHQLKPQYKCAIMPISEDKPADEVSSIVRFVSDPMSTQVTMFVFALTSILRVLLKQYRSPTNPNKFKSATIISVHF